MPMQVDSALQRDPPTTQVLHPAASGTALTLSGQMLAATLVVTGGSTLPAGDIVTADLADLGVTNAKLNADVQRPNMLTNGGFEIWQLGTTFAAMANTAYGCDQWQFIKGGTSALTMDRESTTVDTPSQYSMKLTYTHNAASKVQQKIEDYYQLRGMTVTVSMRVRANAANAIRLRIDDSVGSGTPGTYHTGGGTFETLTATKVIDAATASYVTIIIELNATVTAFCDNSMCVIGSVATTYVPLMKEDDLARCLRFNETLGGDDASQSFGIGQATGGTNAYVPVRFSKKFAVPTITISAAAHFQALNASAGANCVGTVLTGGNTSKDGTTLTLTVASGLVAGDATLFYAAATTSAKITMQAAL